MTTDPKFDPTYPVYDGSVFRRPDGFCSCTPVGDGVQTFAADCGIQAHRLAAISEGRETPVFGTGLQAKAP